MYFQARLHYIFADRFDILKGLWLEGTYVASLARGGPNSEAKSLPAPSS